VLSVLVLGGLSVSVGQYLWPGGYLGRTTLVPNWYLWAAVVVLTQFASGFAGGLVIALVSKYAKLKTVLFAAILALVVLLLPVVWSADRPFEARWLLFVSLLTALAIPVGWFALARRRRPKAQT
jgi:hypothetical protein